MIITGDGKMSGTGIYRKTTALMLAAVFTLVTVFSMAAAPAYAATKTPSKVDRVEAGTTQNTIVITWKKAKNAKKYLVYRAPSKKGKYKKISTTAKTTFVDSKLKKGTKYFYKVRAVNGKKKGAFSSIKSITTKNSEKYDVIVDKTTKTVTISAILNRKYFDESTRHLIIDQYRFNKGKAILTSYCSPEELYYGLTEAGGISWSKSEGKKLKDGEKNTVSNAENKNFSHIDVAISWGDKTYSLSECLTTEKGKAAAPEIDMIFSGNPKAAAKTPSGCVTCMDSCYIGIVANCAYGLCVIDHEDPALFARPEAFPAEQDGDEVKVIFTIK